MAYSKLVIEQTFDTIWETWINKDGERASQKALDVALKSGINKDDLIKACEVYRLENLRADPDFTYKLSNFINQDHWEDYLVNPDKLKREYSDALEVVNAWNEACHPHWCKSLDVELKVPVAIKAMRDGSFKTNWRKALAQASKIFRYPAREGDPKQKIILSFKWFTNVLPDKHTVLKILEGEYGYPQKEEKIRLVQTVEIDHAARAEAAAEMAKMFPELQNKPKKMVRKTDGPSIQAVELANSILKATGGELIPLPEKPKPIIPTKENLKTDGCSKEAIKIANGIINSLTSPAPKASEGDDEFTLV
jgi:hypothetical protein